MNMEGAECGASGVTENAIHIHAMPYVPGVACGVIQYGAGSVGPGNISILGQAEIGVFAHRPSALVIVQGAPFSHTMIGLLGLGIPTVIVTPAQAARLEAGRRVLLDGVSGLITSTVDTDLAGAPQSAAAPGHAVQTRDGVEVNLRASVRTAHAAQQAVAVGAQAIGLVRSEFFVPQSGDVPTRAYYEAAFRELCQAAAPLSLTLRLLDLAGDKIPAWIPSGLGVGGTLGVQGVRLFGLEPAGSVFHAQLAATGALLDAFAIRLLIPYLTRFEELCYWRDYIRDRLPQTVALGAMVETPGGALDIANWCEVADFVAIGCNDLMQCLFAADRDRPELAAWLDPCAPFLFRFFRQMAEAAAERLPRVQLCGVLPQLPGVLPILLGLGYRSVSVDPVSIPYLAHTVRGLSIAEVEALARAVCAATTSAQVAEIAGLRVCAPWPFPA